MPGQVEDDPGVLSEAPQGASDRCRYPAIGAVDHRLCIAGKESLLLPDSLPANLYSAGLGPSAWLCVRKRFTVSATPAALAALNAGLRPPRAMSAKVPSATKSDN
jgi:hypothetical protein